MARPKNTINTKSKTISVNSEDDMYMIKNGLLYRNIITLGIQAHQKNWNYFTDDLQIKSLQTRIANLSLTLNDYARRFEKLCFIVEKGLNLKVKDDLSNVEELEKKIDKVYFKQ